MNIITDPDTETAFYVNVPNTYRIIRQVVSIEGEGDLTTIVFAKLFQSRQHTQVVYEL
jgi:hypothetical protein